eukprot:8181961-Ditylum_brightwellii.AAC.1
MELEVPDMLHCLIPVAVVLNLCHTVAVLFSRCFCIEFSSRPGHVEKYPPFTAFFHVEWTGLKQT